MEQLIILARQLGSMRIFNVTLEVDYNELVAYKEAIEVYMKDGTTIQYGEKFERGVAPQVFIKLYGVKMLIVCRNIWIEAKD